MSPPKSLLAELDGLRGENLLTRALSLVINDCIQQGDTKWTEPLFGAHDFTEAKPEYAAEAGASGRIDLMLQRPGSPGIGIEVKLDAVFQDQQIEHYLKWENLQALYVLAPRARQDEVALKIEDAIGKVPAAANRQKRAEFLAWESLTGELMRKASAIASAAQAPQRTAWLMQEICLYYAQYTDPFDPDAMRALGTTWGTHGPGLQDLPRDAASALIKGVSRLQPLNGKTGRLSPSGIYVGVDITTDPKESPLGWLGFVQAAEYGLCRSDGTNTPFAGWQLVLCTTRHARRPPEVAPAADGLVPAQLVGSQHRGITLHAEPDATVHVVTGPPAAADPTGTPELWTRRLQAVFGPDGPLPIA